MGDSEGSAFTIPFLQSFAHLGKGYGIYGALGAILFALVLPLCLLGGKKKAKQRGSQADAGGEPGFTLRNAKFTELVRVPWEGAESMSALFEQSCRMHANQRFLGTRKFIAKQVVTAKDGRKFEKLHLGDYEWKSYAQAFVSVSNFASGLVKLGHDVMTPAALFSESRAGILLLDHSITAQITLPLILNQCKGICNSSRIDPILAIIPKLLLK